METLTFWQGAVLGLVQGVTEFLPLSSSGHLVIFQKVMGFSQAPVSFDILVHGATLISVLYYFRSAIWSLAKSEIMLLIIGSIPAGIAGLFLEPYLEFMFDSTELLVAGFVLTGAMMIATKYIKERSEENSAKKAFIIGIYQAIAIFPSVSRSGSTVFGALVTGLSVKKAFTFSFILSIPAIAGAVLIHFLKNPEIYLTEGHVVGFIVALVSSLISIKILQNLMVNKKLHFFGYYCLLLSLILLIFPL